MRFHFYGSMQDNYSRWSSRPLPSDDVARAHHELGQDPTGDKLALTIQA